MDEITKKGGALLERGVTVSRGQNHKTLFETLGVGILEKVLRKEFPGEDPTVLREKIGVNHSSMGDYDLTPALGKEFTLPTFVSTSLGEKTVGAFKLEPLQLSIKVPKGRPPPSPSLTKARKSFSWDADSLIA